MIKLNEVFKEDAEEMKEILTLFSSKDKRDAEIISCGVRKDGKR